MTGSEPPGRDELDEVRRGQVAEAVMAGRVVDDPELARAGVRAARRVKRANAFLGVGTVAAGLVLGMLIPFDTLEWDVVLVTTGMAALIGGGFVVPYQKGRAAEEANTALLEGRPVPAVVAPSRAVRVVAALYVLVVAAFGVFWLAQAVRETTAWLGLGLPVLTDTARWVLYVGTVAVVWGLGARALIRSLHRRPGRSTQPG